jgi:hypothetical protein
MCTYYVAVFRMKVVYVLFPFSLDAVSDSGKVIVYIVLRSV